MALRWPLIGAVIVLGVAMTAAELHGSTTFLGMLLVILGMSSVLYCVTAGDEVTKDASCSTKDASQPLATSSSSNDAGKSAAKFVPRQEGVRHVYFDFDQTISVIHVFKQVAGWEPGVPPPAAYSERGQIYRISDLNNSGKWGYNGATGKVEDHAEGASWTSSALGGLDRVQKLRDMFTEFRNAGIKMTIITKGNVGAVQLLLTKEGLLDFFETVFGLIGDSYGESEFDVGHALSPFEGTEENRLNTSKAELIYNLMAQQELNKVEDAILVEDDIAEIQSVDGICKSLYVRERRGMTDVEMDNLRTMVGLDAPPPRN